MKALLVAAAALLGGAAFAQGPAARDDGAVCRSFCDADATQCRKGVQRQAALDEIPSVDIQSVQRADRDDLSAQKLDQVQRAIDKDRFAGTRHCGDARLACRQECGAPRAAAAPSAP